MLAQRALGQCGQVGHRQNRALQGEGQALDHTDGNPHAGERARATAKGDGIQRIQRHAGLGQQLLDHRQQLLGVHARDHLVMAGYLAVMQQRDGTGFGRGIQGQQGGHRTGIQVRKKRAAV
ncbi:hypothetical protein D9M71_699090 [compost metagenome]